MRKDRKDSSSLEKKEDYMLEIDEYYSVRKEGQTDDYQFADSYLRSKEV